MITIPDSVCSATIPAVQRRSRRTPPVKYLTAEEIAAIAAERKKRYAEYAKAYRERKKAAGTPAKGGHSTDRTKAERQQAWRDRQKAKAAAIKSE